MRFIVWEVKFNIKLFEITNQAGEKSSAIMLLCWRYPRGSLAYWCLETLNFMLCPDASYKEHGSWLHLHRPWCEYVNRLRNGNSFWTFPLLLLQSALYLTFCIPELLHKDTALSSFRTHLRIVYYNAYEKIISKRSIKDNSYWK